MIEIVCLLTILIYFFSILTFVSKYILKYGCRESHINNSKDIEVRVALPTNTAHKTVQLSEYKMHII